MLVIYIKKTKKTVSDPKPNHVQVFKHVDTLAVLDSPLDVPRSSCTLLLVNNCCERILPQAETAEVR